MSAGNPVERYVSLEDPSQRSFAREDPLGFLGRFPRGVVLDEVQHCPELLSYLQTRVDEERRMGQFVLTGSRNFGLISRISQSLAGRAGIVQLLPFSLGELRSAGRSRRGSTTRCCAACIPRCTTGRCSLRWELVILDAVKAGFMPFGGGERKAA